MNYTTRGKAVSMKAPVVKEVETVVEAVQAERKPIVEEKPLEIPVSGVIKGWTEALKMMHVGSKWKLYIPSELGYGERGAGNGAIPGGATLIFEVELVAIVKKK